VSFIISLIQLLQIILLKKLLNNWLLRMFHIFSQLVLVSCNTIIKDCVKIKRRLQRKEPIMRKLSSFLFGAFLGGVVGLLVGGLLAPASGEELRQRISDFGNKTVAEIRQAAQRKREELEEELAKLRQPNSKQAS
jgi:hypothetical protein